MNRLLFAFLLGGICFSASANPHVNKLLSPIKHQIQSTKKTVFDYCCVTVQKTKDVSYYCTNNSTNYTATLTQTASYCGPNDCTQSFFKASQIVDNQMMTAENAWSSSRRKDCDDAPPVE